METISKDRLIEMLDEVKEMWLNRVEFIHDKGLDDEYFEWLQNKHKR